MHPLPGLALERFQQFVEQLQPAAPRLSGALAESVPVVQQALRGVQEGKLDPEEATQKVLSQLQARLPPRGHSEHSLVETAERRVQVLFRGEAQSLRSDRVRLLVADRFVRNMAVGYQVLLNAAPGSSPYRERLLQSSELLQAIRRLCTAAAVLTPLSVRTSLGDENLSLEKMLGELPAHFLGGKRHLELDDVNALLKGLRLEMSSVVGRKTRVEPRTLKHEVKMAAALLRDFGERFEQLQDEGRTPGASAQALHARCLALLIDFSKQSAVRLQGKTEHPALHPVVRFAELERCWAQLDGNRPSGVQLTESMTRVRVVLNAFSAEASKND